MRELLVVEDSDEDFDALARTCRQVGFTVPLRRITDADDALAYLRGLDWADASKQPLPSLILLDLNLPGTDGRELLATLKADPVLTHVPVVVFTSSANDNDIAFCYRHHANAYHLKPMNVDVLEADVRALLDYWFAHVVAPLVVHARH